MPYSLQPVTREQAVANRRSAAFPAMLLMMLAILSGIGVAVAISYLVADVTAKPAWIALLITGGLATVGFVGTRRAMVRVRYRITVFLSSLRLMLILGCAVLALWGLGSASEAAHLHSGFRVATLVLFAVFGGAVVFHLSTSTLFAGDCFGLLFRRTRVGWDTVWQIVLTAGSKSETV